MRWGGRRVRGTPWGCPVDRGVAWRGEPDRPAHRGAAVAGRGPSGCSTPAAGTALFVGTTRSPNQGREVDELQYEAFRRAGLSPRWSGSAAATHGPGRAAPRPPGRGGRGGRAERDEGCLGPAPGRGLRRLPRADRRAQGDRAHLEEGALGRWRRVGGDPRCLRWSTASAGSFATCRVSSVTDKCNFRCLYCMPEDGLALAGQGRRAGPRRADPGPAGSPSTSGSGPCASPVASRPPCAATWSTWSPPWALGVELSITTNGFLMDRLAEPLRWAA